MEDARKAKEGDKKKKENNQGAFMPGVKAPIDGRIDHSGWVSTLNMKK
jgi:hypothetical protein